MLTWSGPRERRIVAGLCFLGALRVFVYSAAFPPFHSTDEPFHFDLIVKYAAGHVPVRLLDERLSAETTTTIVLYGTGWSRPRPDLVLLHHSPEYLNPLPPDGAVPPPVWTAPAAVREAVLPWGRERWNSVNYEAMEPPVYYAVAGAWYRLGGTLGLTGGQRFYWTRFLNALLAAGLVAIAALFARAVCPDNRALALAVPLLVAAFPQDSFYGTTNDAPLAPLLFGAALWALLQILRAAPPWPWYVLAGVLVAATVLTKYSHVAIVGALGLALAVVGATRRDRAEYVRLGGLVLIVLVLIGAWVTRNVWLAGEVTGSHQKAVALGWSVKSLAAIGDHPFFGRGAILALIGDFGTDLLATFWRGEITWHGRPMTLPGIDRVYILSSVLLLTCAVIRAAGARVRAERLALGISAATLLLAVAAVAALSTVFDFGTQNQYPSRARPYFTQGRLLVGTLVPFVTLYLYGLQGALSWARLRCAGALLIVTIAIALVALGAQLVVIAPVFASSYNWFHLVGR